MKKYLWVQDGFATEARALRAAFDAKFADPRRGHSDRFVWDYWHVPDQYTLLRTPAQAYFPAQPMNAFLDRLARWGRETLGCAALSPPWLSNYVEGCRQELHSDVPHGPWAYVFSLSPARPKFTGGETQLLRPGTLDYWRSFTDAADRELSSFVERVAPKFNRLVVFDPRLPHGVTPVRGVHDPREGRLVVHGWFTDPRPCLTGPLRPARAAPILDEAVARLVESLAAEGRLHGMLSLRIPVSAKGAVGRVSVLADSLVSLDGNSRAPALARAAAGRLFGALRFPAARGPSRVTLPLLFR